MSIGCVNAHATMRKNDFRVVLRVCLHIGVDFVLLVSLTWAMRRPQSVEQARMRVPRFFMYIGVISVVKQKCIKIIVFMLVECNLYAFND